MRYNQIKTQILSFKKNINKFEALIIRAKFVYLFKKKKNFVMKRCLLYFNTTQRICS